MSESKSGINIGFFGLMALMFIGLKITNQIDWSWWWVLAPIWGYWALVASIAAVCLVVLIAIDLFAPKARKPTRSWIDELAKASEQARKPSVN